MTRVVLGNHHAKHSRDNGETVEPLKGKRALIVDPGPDDSLSEIFTNITKPEGVWAAHSVFAERKVKVEAGQGVTSDTGRQKIVPAWVASDSAGLAALLAEHFGGIEIRELEDVKTKDGAVVPGGALLSTTLAVMALGLLLWLLTPWLKTNAGNDVQAAQMSGSASATAVLKWVALTANATAPSASDTTLTAEIATAGGGLIRKIGTYAHTTGASSYTITTTFTGNGSDAYPVTIAKRGIFDAASAGNMGFETLVSPTATLAASGDALTLTDTISM